MGKLLLQNKNRSACILLCVVCWGFFSACLGDIGGQAGGYLRYPLGAREVSMGGAQTASPQELSTWWNPAMLCVKRNTQLSFGGGLMSLGRTQGYAELAFKISPRVGMGIMPVYRGDILLNNLYDENEQLLESGSFATLSMKIALSYLATRKLSVGISMGYYYQRLPTSYNQNASLNYSSATAVGGLDFGVRYVIHENWICGATIQNIDLLKWLSSSSPSIELTWEVGSSDNISASVLERIAPALVVGNQVTLKLHGRPFIWVCDLSGYALDGEFKKLDHMQIRLNNGVEWKRWDSFSLRAGVGDALLNQTVFSDAAGLNPRIALGFGANLSKFKKGLMFNYAIATDRIWAGVDQQTDLTYSF